MSRVFLAEETRLNRRVVIKVLPGDMSAGVSAERFEREIHLAANLQDPHIVPILAAGETSHGVPFYTMPFVEGESLRHRMEAGGLSFQEAVDVLKDVAMALESAHRHNVIHRDIKPGNVLLTGRSAVVTDFGIAKALSESRGSTTDATLTTAGMSVGTPAYMSPEQASGDQIDIRTDLYSWGVLAYELLGGTHPFPGRETRQQLLAAHVTEAPRPLDEVNPGLPPQLEDLVMRCLEKNREDRPQSAAELLSVFSGLAVAGASDPRPVGPWLTRRRGAALALAAVTLIALGLLYQDRREQTWAKDVAAPEIEALARDQLYEEGHRLARRALAILPDDSTLREIASGVSREVSVLSEPTGAQVYRRPYLSDESDWESLGSTPLQAHPMPRGLSRLRIEAPGYRPYEVGTFGPEITVVLRPGSGVDGAGEMVRVPGSEVIPAYWITGLGHLEPRELADFEFGRYEVSNRQFQAFVDAGGYARRELWDDVIRRDGQPLPWDEAMRLFVDATGRPGPSTWELGRYPAGEDDFPVSGVSWYEARAYARFAGRQLPTIYHWMLAASSTQGDLILPSSNVGGARTAPVGQHRGMSAYGAFDVAGNVREWTVNAMGDNRFILGGGHGDPPYMFYNVNYLDASDRSSENGFRLADFSSDPSAELLASSIAGRLRDFSTEEPASDEIYAVYRRLYDYDHVALAARIESTDTTPEWIRERITFAGPDGDERVIAYLFVPPHGDPPYQTVVFFPGAQSLIGRNPMPPGGYGNFASLVTRTGRAFMHPVYKGTFERRLEGGVGTWYPNETTAYRDLVLTMGKELRRSVDYLSTRPELVDADNLAYMGHSWGGSLAGVMMAIEPRFKAGVLNCPGLTMARPQPEVDPFHFLPRVTIPVLMVAGRHDAIFPLEASQLPMFRLLGSTPEEKRHVVVESAHCSPRNAFMGEALDWMDRWLGPVR
jgi:dienelactone hydrolase